MPFIFNKCLLLMKDDQGGDGLAAAKQRPTEPSTKDAALKGDAQNHTDAKAKRRR